MTPPLLVGALDTLQERTRATHDRLDQGLRLATGEVTQHRYVTYLEQLAPLLLAADALLEIPGIEGALPDARARLKSRAIRDDLADLGAEWVPRAALLPPTRDIGSLFGVLYVFEESALSGVVLARQVEEALGAVPTRYLRFYGSALGSMWSAFCTSLEGAARDDLGRERLVRSARITYELIARRLARTGLLIGDPIEKDLENGHARP
jgi:heme oxygenase